MNPNYLIGKTSRAFSLLGLVALVATTAEAADKQWIGGTASYNLGSRWNAAGVPGGGDNAINNSGAGNTVLISATDPNWTVNDIRSGDGGANQGPWLQTGANVTLNGWFRLGIGSGVGKYEMSGGNLTVNAARFNVGEGGTALFNFTGGTITKNGGGDFAVPDGGTGVMNQTNGVLNIVSGEFWVGQGGSANGTYNLTSNGVLQVNDWVAIGRGGGTGVVNMSDNTSVTKGGANSFIIGASGFGTWNQTGGAVTNNSTVTWLGESSTGIWNLSAGNVALANIILGVNGGSSGTLNLNGGVFAVNQMSQGGGSAVLNFNGGTLRARVANASFMSGVPGNLMAGGAVIDSGANDITISSALADSGGGTLTKIGSGTLTLSGANSYTGKTIVSVGKLIDSTAASTVSDVTVANGAGYGVSLASLGGQVTRPSVTLSGAANSLTFVLGGFGNTTVAPAIITALTNNGTTAVNVSGSTLAVGQFPLVQYGTKTGAGTFVIGTLPAGVSATVSNNVANSTIDLVISSTALIRWDGRVAGSVWDINTTTNWTDYLTTASAKFINGAAIYFDDLALGSTTVNLGVAVLPGSMIVTNDGLAYTITGNGSINGVTSLIKQGGNTLTITTTNGYTGATTISGGTVSVNKLANGGSNSSLGSSSASAANLVLDGGTLSYTGPATSSDRGYTLNSSNSTLNLVGDLTSSGAVSANVGANFAKTGNGTLTLKRAGANTLSQGGGIGAYDIYNGTVIMDGTGSGQVNTVNGEFSVGTTPTSTGPTLTLTNTTLNVSSWFSISRGTGGGGNTSTVNLYNSALKSVNAAMCFDNNLGGTLQSGVLNMYGTSTFTNNGDSNMGESGGGSATINLNDSSVFYSNNRMQVGFNSSIAGAATGTVTVANSAKIVVNAWMSIGNSGGVGSVLLKDSSSVSCGDLNVCDVNTGTGVLVAQDNAVINAGNIFIGKGNGSVGTFTITNNATVVSANGITIASTGGSAGDGTVNLAGGSLAVNLAQGVTGNSVFNFNGGRLIAKNPFAANFMFNLTAINVLAGGAFIDSSNYSIAISQPLLDGGTGGGLTKLGSGTLLLNAINTYTGNTIVSAGTLGGSGTLASAVTVQSAATLFPSGGTGIATLTINSNLTIVGNIAVDVNKTNTPTTNDIIVVTGTLLNTGTGTVKVTNVGTNTVQIGDRFTLFSQPVTGGAALTVLPSAGVVWTNKLAIDGSIQAVSIIAAPVVTPGGVNVLPNGNVTLTATGTVGSTYKLWGTTNLLLSPIATTWQLVNSGTVTTSPFSVTDTTASGSAQKFYIFSTP